MNPEKLKKLQMQVRIGGKGTPRRKKKIVHATAATDDKKLQSSLKKLSVNTIPGIEEVNMIKDDGTVIHFNNPKAQASLAANTFAINGHGEHKQITEMLPGILTQLGPEGLNQLKRLANNVIAGNKLLSVNEEDDVPTVDNFEEVAKKEIEQAAAKKSPLFENMDTISADAFAQAVAALAMTSGTGGIDDVIKEVEASTKVATTTAATPAAPTTATAATTVPVVEKKEEPAKKEGTPKKGDDKKKDNKKNDNKKNENKKTAEPNAPKKSDDKGKKENSQGGGKKEAAAKKADDKPKEKTKDAAPQGKKGGGEGNKKPEGGAAPKKDDKQKESAKKQQQESKKTNESANKKQQAADSKKSDAAAAVASKKSEDAAPASTTKPSA